MHPPWQRSTTWLLAWAGLTLAGALALVRWDIAQRREAFLSDARIAHRLLSQRAVQHEAILATLALLDTEPGNGRRPEARLPAVYPQVLAVLRRRGNERWSEPDLQLSEERSRAAGHALLGSIDDAAGQFTLVLAGEPSSYALRIDVQRMLPWDTWPLARGGPVRAVLLHGADAIVLQPGAPAESRPAGLTAGFAFTKTLDAPSQPFELQLQRATGPAEWPWRWLGVWSVFSALMLAALSALWRGVREKRRAIDLLRVGQVARLNTMGELAGGVAHELNQPLTALLANTQAARRLLDDEPPALDDARRAMAQAAAQARRAADVVARLRRLVATPDATLPLQPIDLAASTRSVAELLEPETRRRGIRVSIEAREHRVEADPVALEQIIHNLMGNAMQALDEVPPDQRSLTLTVGAANGRGLLHVRDSGPGIAAEALPRLFEPFFTTRTNSAGLGLGLSL
ncbi:MAG: HAMP domain-containing sensor histidine kinase, partial [Variovorax sp.]